MNARFVARVTNELAALDWLGKAGIASKTKLRGARRVATAREAGRHLASTRWGAVTLEAQNWLSSTLSVGFRAQDRDWNKLVAKGRRMFTKVVAPHVDRLARSHPELGDALEISVRHDVMLMFTERYYLLACLPDAMWFSRELEVYRAGYLPCGYDYGGRLGSAVIDGTGTLLYF